MTMTLILTMIDNLRLTEGPQLCVILMLLKRYESTEVNRRTVLHPFWIQLVLALLAHHFSTFETSIFCQGSLTRVQYPKCAYDPYCYSNPIENSVFIIVEVSSIYFNYLLSVHAGGPVSSRGHMKRSSTADFRWFVAFWEHQNFPF